MVTCTGVRSCEADVEEEEFVELSVHAVKHRREHPRHQAGLTQVTMVTLQYRDWGDTNVEVTMVTLQCEAEIERRFTEKI